MNDVLYVILLLSVIFGGAYNAFSFILTTEKERCAWSNKRLYWHVVLSGPVIWVIAVLLLIFLWIQSRFD